MTFRCNKGELGDCEEGIPIVTACTLVNMYADKSRNDIHVHYITTKFYYEGLGYATYLLYELCKDRRNNISFVLYREVLLNSHKIHTKCPKPRKSRLEARYPASPLHLFRIMKLRENKIAFHIHCLFLYHKWWSGTTHAVLIILARK